MNSFTMCTMGIMRTEDIGKNIEKVDRHTRIS